jgi:fructan beta-fructosidase
MNMRNLLVQNQYLNLPVKTGSGMKAMELWVEGVMVRKFELELADEEIDFWAFSDVSEFIGKNMRIQLSEVEGIGDLQTDANGGTDADELGQTQTLNHRLQHILHSDTPVGEKELYKEAYRPRFHFTSRRGRLNDPNGLVYLDGEYHLFYQHNPYGLKWGNIHWGHAVSRDLVHWEELPAALYPDEIGMIFSGSAVVDESNTSGLFDGNDGLVAYFTYHTVAEGQLQCFSVSSDKGRTWTKYKDYLMHPLKLTVNNDFRDPKILWHAKSSKWIMVVYEMMEENCKTIAFYSSNNLKAWEYESHIEGFYECPDLFCLPVDGDEGNRKWVLIGGDGRYRIGEFDGHAFVPETSFIPSDYGHNFYAPQTYSNLPEHDGRCIQITWMRHGQYPGMPFNQQMTFPCELKLTNTEAGVRICKMPVREINQIRGKCFRISDKAMELRINLLEPVQAELQGEIFDIEADLHMGSSGVVRLDIHGAMFICNALEQRVEFMGKTIKLDASPADIQIRMLVDITSIEIYINGGQVSISNCYLPDPLHKGLGLYLVDGEAAITSFQVWELMV